MNNTVIPAGYRLTVVSWENDGDAYNTKIVEGLNKRRTEFLIELAELCRGKFGNMYEPDTDELALLGDEVIKLFEKFPEELDNEEEALTSEVALDYFHEFLYDLMGGSEFYTRVLDSWNVELVPHEISLENVSEQFRKPGKRH